MMASDKLRDAFKMLEQAAQSKLVQNHNIDGKIHLSTSNILGNAFNYTPPIQTVMRDVELQIENGVYKDVQGYNIDVDKDELIKALQHDREQYIKGYVQGRVDGIKEFVEQHKEIMRAFLYSDSTDFLMKWCEYETNTDNLLREMVGDT